MGQKVSINSCEEVYDTEILIQETTDEAIEISSEGTKNILSILENEQTEDCNLCLTSKHPCRKCKKPLCNLFGVKMKNFIESINQEM